MTANEELRDSMISHAVYFERYKTHEVNQLFKVIDAANRAAKAEVQKTDGAATKARYQAIMKKIGQISAEARESIDGQLRLDLMDLIESESDFLPKAITSAVGVDLEMVLPAPKQVFTAATFMPFSASATFESMLIDIDKDLYSQWDMSVRVGYLTGETAQVINRRVLGSISGLQVGTMTKFKRDLEANTRTLLAHYADQTRKAVYRENEDIFQGYQRLETLDPRTCLVCGVLDGKVYKRLEDDPGVVHLRCRGLAVPILKGWEGLGITERASVDGVVPGTTNYEEWLKNQSVERQKDILGPSRYELYKNGAPLGSFAVDGKTLTLEQWRSVESNKTYKANVNVRNLSPEYSKLSSNEKDAEITNWLIKKGVTSGRERALVTDLSGNVLSVKKGEPSSVGISGNLRTVLFNSETNSVIFYHNHPGSSAFSKEDMEVACHIDSIAEIKAIGHNGTRYTIDARKSHGISREQIRESYFNCEKEAKIVYDELYYTGKIDADAANIGYSRYVNELMAKRFGWTFSIKEPE